MQSDTVSPVRCRADLRVKLKQGDYKTGLTQVARNCMTNCQWECVIVQGSLSGHKGAAEPLIQLAGAL